MISDGTQLILRIRKYKICINHGNVFCQWNAYRKITHIVSAFVVGLGFITFALQIYSIWFDNNFFVCFIYSAIAFFAVFFADRYFRKLLFDGKTIIKESLLERSCTAYLHVNGLLYSRNLILSKVIVKLVNQKKYAVSHSYDSFSNKIILDLPQRACGLEDIKSFLLRFEFDQKALKVKFE